MAESSGAVDWRSPEDLAKDVYAFYGLTAYKAHILERGLVNVLATALWPRPLPWASDAEYQGRFDQLSRLTLGPLVDRVCRAGIQPELAGELRVALKERDRLIHRFFSEHVWEFASPDGLLRMLDDLDRMRAVFERCDAEVDAITYGWFAAHGVTAEHFENAYSELHSALDGRRLTQPQGRPHSE